ncbi:MAG TPA: UDP-glucose/GDP-mannose dehydrogenase family protein, partial [Gaiellaceae bacterium]|nr:UDP-glucose/GDP-mannose dehydrogenase family protein [Gaiellaceae bacterium]
GERVLPQASIHAAPLDALDGADAAVLVTEWGELAQLDWEEAARRMRKAVLIDGRNMLDPAAMREAGFVYEGIGRAAEPVA